jgi:hypothetical protein
VIVVVISQQDTPPLNLLPHTRKHHTASTVWVMPALFIPLKVTAKGTLFSLANTWSLVVVLSNPSKYILSSFTVIMLSIGVASCGGGGGGGGGPLDPKDPDDDDDGRVRGDRDVFGVQCIPEKSAYLVGEVVTFNATVDGDIDEDDADFDWAGHSSIDEDDERATAQYTTPGIKEVSVRAEYNGDTERDTCYVQIARSGVTLDQVPYTGPGDMTKTIGFIMTLVLLSGIGGYAMIRRREETGIPVGIPTKNN